MKKRIFIIFFICVIVIFSVWQFNTEPNILEEEAISVVNDQYSSNTGEIEILSIKKRWGNYIVEWEKEENCEKGVNTVDGDNAEIIKGKVTIC